MPQYLVLSLMPGATVPPENQEAKADFVLTTQASVGAAATAASNTIKPNPGDKMWVVDVSALAPYTATLTYGANAG